MAAGEQKALLPKTAALFFYLPTALSSLPGPGPEKARAEALARAALGELTSLPRLRKAIQNLIEQISDPDELRASLQDLALLPKTKRLFTISLSLN